MKLQALFDCGSSDNVVRRLYLENSRLKFIERDTSPKKMMVRLPTIASVIVTQRVIGIHYILENVQHGGYFIVFDLNDKFNVTLG